MKQQIFLQRCPTDEMIHIITEWIIIIHEHFYSTVALHNEFSSCRMIMMQYSIWHWEERVQKWPANFLCKHPQLSAPGRQRWLSESAERAVGGRKIHSPGHLCKEHDLGNIVFNMLLPPMACPNLHSQFNFTLVNVVYLFL